jgi:hypothetical protein
LFAKNEWRVEKQQRVPDPLKKKRRGRKGRGPGE